jgi:tol-pal system protein YbgF
MRSFLYLTFFIILANILILSTGCGSSRQTVDEGGVSTQSDESEYDEIEKLLGITRDESGSSRSSSSKTSQEPSQASEQDDLIRLLEVDEGKPREQTVTGTGIEDQRVVRLQNQVDELEKEIQKKDMEIADLKTQLMVKEEELSKKPAVASTVYSQPSQSSYTASPPPSSSGPYSDRYHETLALFHERRYQEAIAGFEDLLARDINHQLSDNAQYWIGESYYAMGMYNEAIIAFEKVYTFPQSNKNDYAQFKIGQCYFKIGNKERASQEFQQLIDTYPDSELVPRARNYLAQF